MVLFPCRKIINVVFPCIDIRKLTDPERNQLLSKTTQHITKYLKTKTLSNVVTSVHYLKVCLLLLFIIKRHAFSGLFFKPFTQKNVKKSLTCPFTFLLELTFLSGFTFVSWWVHCMKQEFLILAKHRSLCMVSYGLIPPSYRKIVCKLKIITKETAFIHQSLQILSNYFFLT